MNKLMIDALLDSLRMIPFLLIIYIGIEFIEFKLEDSLIKRVKHAGKIAPALGSAFGLVPQCGFSVMASALYAKRVITVGTLLAVYISTSDEALPIILAHPDKAFVIFPLLLTKFVLAITAGYSIDLLLHKSSKSTVEGELCATAESYISKLEVKGDLVDEKGCCDHSITEKKIALKELIMHPIIHTFKIFLFILIATIIINLIIFNVGEQNLANVFLKNSIFQPILVSFFGLIPNCAASIAITQIFLQGGLSFGSTVAGLSAGAGLGILILFRENTSIKDTLRIVTLLLIISSTAGIMIQSIYG